MISVMNILSVPPYFSRNICIFVFMKIKKQIILFFLLTLITLFAYELDAQSEEFGTWDIGINTGLYLPSNAQAAFYNGSEANENKMSFVFDNPYRRDEIKRLVNASDTIVLSEMPSNMKYTPAFQIGLYFRRTFDNYTGLSLQFNYSKLTAADKFTIEVDPLSIANLGDIRIYDIIGVEERVNIDLLFSKYFKSKNPSFIPFMEAGFNLNSTRVQEHSVLIEEQTYSLINTLGNQSYVPGVQQNNYIIQQGGIGTGLALGGGLRIVHNNQVSIDPGFMIYVQGVNLPPYDTYNLGAVFYVRLSLANFFGGDSEYE